MPTRRRDANPVFDEVRPAIEVLAEALGISTHDAREALRAVVLAGYVIGPREPTNAMLVAYITSYGPMPVNPSTVVTAVGKARSRWRAMAEQATAMTLSTKRVRKPRKTLVDTAQSAGGKARAKALTAQERSDIARKAANARWGKTPDH